MAKELYTFSTSLQFEANSLKEAKELLKKCLENGEWRDEINDYLYWHLSTITEDEES